jgi:hypothetical protein
MVFPANKLARATGACGNSADTERTERIAIGGSQALAIAADAV